MMNDFNFFEPYVYTKTNIFKVRYFVILLLIAMTAVYYFNFSEITRLTSENNKLIDDIQVISENGYLTELEVLQVQNDSLKNRINFTVNFEEFISDTYVINNNLFIDLTSRIPEEMYFESWSLTNDSITMEGIAFERTVIAEFEANLRDAGYKDVFIDAINESTDLTPVEYSFTISMSLGGNTNENE
jgi:type IV pilus assembly protein PilN